MTKEARRRSRGGPPGHQTPPRRGPQPGRAWVDPGPPLTDPFRVYLLHGKPNSGGSSREIFRRLCGAETTKREKLSCRLQICRGNSLPEGETISIVTAIELDFIGIIIISTTR